MKPYILILSLCMLTLSAMAQEERNTVRKGNRAFDRQEYTDAEILYRKALDQKAESFDSRFNLGDALFRQEKYPEAAAEWQTALRLLPTEKGKYAEGDRTKAAHCYHNIGNSCYAQQDFGKAVEAYKQALRLNPKDDETRYNLVKALEMLKQQQQDQQNQDQQQNQQNQDQQQQQQQQQEQEQQQDQQQEQQPDPQEMDKEQAEQILQALEQDEQATQEKAKRQPASSRFRTDKDW